MEWDGPEAFEPPADARSVEQPPATTRKSKTQPSKRTERTTQVEESETKWTKPQRQSSPVEMSQSSDDESGDEYVDDEGIAAAGTKRQRRVRQTNLTSVWPRWANEASSHSLQNTLGTNSRRVIAMSSESDDDSDDGYVSERDGKVRRRGPGAATTPKVKTSASPQPSGALKRKQSISAAGAGAGKRKRTESLSTTMAAADDPARKYCLGKFSEMFTGIFLRYPYVRQKGEAREGEGEGKGEVPQELELVERKTEELSEEDKTQAKERATAFATEVEQAVFDTYAEADKFGKNGVGAKYKYVLASSLSFHVCSWSGPGSASVQSHSTYNSPIACCYTSVFHPRR